MVDRVRRTVLAKIIVLLTALFVVGLPVKSTVAQDALDNEQIDRSINRALKYLSAQQQPSGAWLIEAFGESTAATSLAVMAFLAAGHTPQAGPYAEQITRGVRWVVEHQEPNGMLVHRRSHGPMYSHGISTLMLAEVAGMTEEDLSVDCQHALERAVRLILQAQDVPKSDRHAGGWRYNPSSKDSDLSVTAWQLMALRAAKNNGCDVPADYIDKAVKYVKNCRETKQGGFGYQPGNGTTPTRTGTGVLALEICGKHHTPEALQGADLLLQKPLDLKEHYFYYGAYYCSVGMFQIGGRHWETTRKQLFPIILSQQKADGSWKADSGSERNAGSIYATSLSVLALAIEYRFLPIYQR